nr:uncharacterized protein LOC117853605 [Setaria viridis]
MVDTVRSGLYGPSPDMNTDVWTLEDSERSVWVKAYAIRSRNNFYEVKALEVLRDGRLVLLKTIKETRATSDHRCQKRRILQLYNPTTGLKIIGTSHSFRVVGGVEGTLVPARLDLVCVDGGELGARVIDPATGRAVTTVGDGRCGGFSTSPTAGSAVLCPARTRSSAAAASVPGDAMTTASLRSPRSHVACFDLESEEWKTTIEAPATEWPKEEERWEITIGELKGTLSMVETVRSLMDGTAYTNIWLLVDSEKSVWVKEYTIHMPRTVSLVEALEVLGDGTILLLSTFEMEGNSHLFERKKMRVLQLYGPSTRVCKDLMKMAEHRFCNKIALYTGSLLS